MDALGISYDVARGHILVSGAGFWKPDDMNRHFEQLTGYVNRERGDRGPIKILVDMRGTSTQSSETATNVGEWTDRLFRPGDRIAFVVSSALVKMQMNRVARGADYGYFEDHDAAQDWLLRAD